MPYLVVKRAALIIPLILLLGMAGGDALAQGKFVNPLGDIDSLTPLIKNIITWMLSLVGILALGAIIWGGVLYIVSGGNDSRIQMAKQIIFWAIVGLVIVTLAFVILSTVSRFLGVAVGT